MRWGRRRTDPSAAGLASFFSTMSESHGYTITEAAALTSRHPNTIRQKIRLGTLEATIQQGKFGEEYRIPHQALVKAGLLTGELPYDETAPEPPHLPGEPDRPLEGRPVGGDGGAFGALTDLFKRHEQAMFRLGYLEGELERAKALAETAESLRTDKLAREEELREVRQELQSREQQAAEIERLRRELEAREADAAETQRLREELERANAKLRELEILRSDLEQLKALAGEQESTIERLHAAPARRSWFWRR